MLTSFCAVILAPVNSAKAYRFPLPPINVSIADQHELGQVSPGISASQGEIAQYVNFMIGLSIGSSDHVIINEQDNLITRSNNNFGPLPGDVTVSLTGTSMMIDLGTQDTYDYLLADYSGSNTNTEIRYVANLNGVITIPGNWDQYGLSGWTLFTGSSGVPDGGNTVMLLGTSLAVLGLARRYLMSR
jgi:hypothetical protein